VPLSIIEDVPVSLGVAVQNEQARVGISIPIGIGLPDFGSTSANQSPRPGVNPQRPPQLRTSGVPPSGELRFVPREVIVRLPSNISPQTLEALARRHALRRIEAHNLALSGTTIHRWQITDSRSVAEVIHSLERETGVLAAQPNYQFSLVDQKMIAIADLEAEQYAVRKLHLPQAHRLATGRNVVIAVIDSGVDVLHPEITGAVVETFDAARSQEPAHQHGTATAGVIVAHARLRGAAPSARILAIRAFAATGKTPQGTTLVLLRAIDWAVSHGARVINMSFAGPTDPELARVLSSARQKGIILIAAAGNAGPKSRPLFPASDINVIAVTATNAEDKRLSMANIGDHIALAAPGADILAPAPSGNYQFISGTSIACAYVSGIAALLLERKSDLTSDSVRKLLMSAATDLGPKGPDPQFGAGLANAERSILSLDAKIAVQPSVVNASAKH
jgi:subtilisin family serine protease